MYSEKRDNAWEIKTKEQVEYLKNIKCDMIQGYYFERPIKVEEFEENTQQGGSRNE